MVCAYSIGLDQKNFSFFYLKDRVERRFLKQEQLIVDDYILLKGKRLSFDVQMSRIIKEIYWIKCYQAEKGRVSTSHISVFLNVGNLIVFMSRLLKFVLDMAGSKINQICRFYDRKLKKTTQIHMLVLRRAEIKKSIAVCVFLCHKFLLESHQRARFFLAKAQIHWFIFRRIKIFCFALSNDCLLKLILELIKRANFRRCTFFLHWCKTMKFNFKITFIHNHNIRVICEFISRKSIKMKSQSKEEEKSLLQNTICVFDSKKKVRIPNGKWGKTHSLSTMMSKNDEKPCTTNEFENSIHCITCKWMNTLLSIAEKEPAY